ncbi:hypothetical protein WMY93_022464 [Mugilogobius chulae]|uniref:Integrase catalytic domain-containing protein n=1 Tax=Mugilogobius chulae TaxID=88201 RepID=A0AAW0NI84_9GOBI
MHSLTVQYLTSVMWYTGGAGPGSGLDSELRGAGPGSGLASEGDSLISSSHYAEDSIQPKCCELRGVCDEVVSAALWCEEGIFLLASQPVDRCQSQEGQRGRCRSWRGSWTRQPAQTGQHSALCCQYEAVLTAQLRKVFQKQTSVQEMFDKRRISLKKLAAKQTRPVQPVAPRPEVKSPQTSPNPQRKERRFSEGSAICKKVESPLHNGNTRHASLSEEEENLAVLRRHVMNELLETERAYVDELLCVLEGYAAEMENPLLSHLIPASLICKKDVLFGNMSEIYHFHKREVKAACVEAEVLEAAAADIEEEKYSEPSNRSPVAVQTLKRTEDYVKEQSSNFGQYVYKDEKTVLHSYFPVSAPAKLQQYSTSGEFAPLPTQPLDRTGVYSEPPILTPNPYKKEEINDSGMPQTQTAFHGTSMNTGNHTFDLARFLARNQVLTSGLNKFDDTPEHYQAWRASFINAIEPLGLTPSEEVDLMVKWLGKESSVHAARIRAVNVDQPMNGLKAVWSRLDKMYGSPEAIESALFSRVEAFPKVQSRDSHKLQELADLLQELEIAKQNSKLCGLAYLDTARGVQPIVEKLPYPLQERWMSKGSKYKKIMVCLFHHSPSSKNSFALKLNQPPPCTEDGGEEEIKQEITSSCTKVCGAEGSGKSCSKIVLVNVYPSGQHDKSKTMYAVLDDQSNLSLARSDFFDMFDIHGTEAPYNITTCMGATQAFGRRAYGYVIESLDKETCLQLPTLIECDNLPNNRAEIPTPEAAYHHKHLKKIASEIPPLDPNAEILILIGRDLLRVHKVQKIAEMCFAFLWYRDNLPGNEVVEYRMRVHIFGNSPSPAIAIYGLRRAAKELERDYSSHTTQLVESHFYMDDALLSFTSETEATETVEQLQEMLAISNLRLHKIASNCVNVINHFPAEDRAKDIKDLDLFADDLPVQRSLGVIWNIMTDTFTFKIPEHTKPFTRRGVLSTVNSLFDPLGFLAPITIKGRMILRDITSDNVEWDAPLPQSKFEEWRRWQESLSVLKDLHIPRTYATFPVTQAKTTELCVFSDASVRAISAVAYLRVTHDDDHHEVGFVLGKAKLAPQPELTIPRLELCAAVLAVEVAETIMQEIHLKVDAVRKLRGLFEQQFMSDLPEERLKVDPPFSYVGLDVFGPWEIVTRRMRGGQVNNKRWAVLFTCMSTRAIHIEVVESLSTSSFINALRRFFSLRGPAKKLRSDRGTNFIGAYNELKLLPSGADPSVKDYLNEQRCTWEFNPPHASHMGGAWERMIGVSRRILDGLLLDVKQPQLTHEVLVTLMAEVTAIVNARPLVPISADPDAPLILTQLCF